MYMMDGIDTITGWWMGERKREREGEKVRYVFIYVCMFACMYVGMYVCICVTIVWVSFSSQSCFFSLFLFFSYLCPWPFFPPPSF